MAEITGVAMSVPLAINCSARSMPPAITIDRGELCVKIQTASAGDDRVMG
jgi:hypothetical protein